MVLQLLTEFQQKWNIFIDKESDQRVKNWFLMSSPFPILILSIIYIILVKTLPKFMKSREPFNMRKNIKTFNISHLIGNIFFFCCFIWYFKTEPNLKLRCMAIDRSPYDRGIQVAELCHAFLIFRMFDMIETILLILSKRDDLVTPYHVAHHFLLSNMVWGVVKFVPGGHALFFAPVNSISHIFLYSYYLILGHFPKFRSNLKKCSHFFVIFGVAEILLLTVHVSLLLVYNDCNFPVGYVYYGFIYSVIFLSVSLLLRRFRDHKVTHTF